MDSLFILGQSLGQTVQGSGLGPITNCHRAKWVGFQERGRGAWNLCHVQSDPWCLWDRGLVPLPPLRRHEVFGHIPVEALLSKG